MGSKAFGIGAPVTRTEDARFLTGRARYLDDIRLERQCYGAQVMSTHAHADITRLDVSAAASAPGVICVLTAAELESDGIGAFPTLYIADERGGPPGFRTLRPLLVGDRVRAVGERIAFVIAETEHQARDAAELVEVEYRPLPAVVRADVAMKTRPIWDGATNNRSFTISFGNAAATDAAFARADRVVSLSIDNNRITANPIETRGAIGDFDPTDERYTLFMTSQAPHSARGILARDVFRIPENRLRIVSIDVGGGFGLKIHPFPEDALVLWAARRSRRPVKWVATRSESFLGDNHGRDQLVHGDLALDANGRILGIRARGAHTIGAYAFHGAVTPVDYSMKLIPSVYDVQAIDVEGHGIFANTTTCSSYRGAGRPEAIMLIERLIEAASRALAIDPIEIRRRNLIRRLPYKAATGFEYDSGDFERILDRCLAAADWAGFAARRAATERTGLLRGRAASSYIESGGRFNERMEIRFDPTGGVTILAGTHSHGQGHATTYAQLVHEWLGVPFESIRFVQGDTDQVQFGRGTYAARSSLAGGGALKVAADRIIENARPMAAHLLEAAASDLEFTAGRFRVAGTDRSVALSDVAIALFRPRGYPAHFGAGLEANGVLPAPPNNHPNGCHACELTVDPETGAVTVERYTVVDDLGVVINPLICEGQVHGGLAQGIGQALMEHIVYEPESGQLLTGSFMDYAMPRADDLPAFAVGFEEIPSTTNPLGIKGIGEAGAIPAPPVIINAILDALAPLGVTDLSMPATPHRVWQAIHRQKTRESS